MIKKKNIIYVHIYYKFFSLILNIFIIYIYIHISRKLLYKDNKKRKKLKKKEEKKIKHCFCIIVCVQNMLNFILLLVFLKKICMHFL